ncbi:unnamed protein product [Caenorhabditis auriculariae]|uniref:Uncharacterized protein n=1 Tax=Caenorhabditis auriculariae TaxID=2777116 RepID=A0A8S1GSH3_9PELO|nr:unnamed protein product [Caenorhabditis auriculariae]
MQKLFSCKMAKFAGRREAMSNELIMLIPDVMVDNGSSGLSLDSIGTISLTSGRSVSHRPPSPISPSRFKGQRVPLGGRENDVLYMDEDHIIKALEHFDSWTGSSNRRREKEMGNHP